MGAITEKKPVKLVSSIIFKDDELLGFAERNMKRLFGPIEELSLTTPFDQTDYYAPEFGKPLSRKIVVFKKLVGMERIYKVKIASNALEARSRKGGNRRVNIDPGYVTDAKLVLLTTKDYSHRIYTGKGIFSEVTLFFQNGSFKAWPWTYPDYAEDELKSFFDKVRGLYMDDLKRLKR